MSYKPQIIKLPTTDGMSYPIEVFEGIVLETVSKTKFHNVERVNHVVAPGSFTPQTLAHNELHATEQTEVWLKDAVGQEFLLPLKNPKIAMRPGHHVRFARPVYYGRSDWVIQHNLTTKTRVENRQGAELAQPSAVGDFFGSVFSSLFLGGCAGALALMLMEGAGNIHWMHSMLLDALASYRKFLAPLGLAQYNTAAMACLSVGLAASALWFIKSFGRKSLLRGIQSKRAGVVNSGVAQLLPRL